MLLGYSRQRRMIGSFSATPRLLLVVVVVIIIIFICLENAKNTLRSKVKEDGIMFIQACAAKSQLFFVFLLSSLLL